MAKPKRKGSEGLKKIDGAIYRGERTLVGYLFFLMAIVVFVDVVHRIFSRTPGRVSVILSALLSGSPTPQALDVWVTPTIIAFSVFFLAFGAIRTRARAKTKKVPPLGKNTVQAVIASVVLGAVVAAFTTFVPQGLVWSPYFGLCSLLWIGLIGASMATYNNQHLTLEMGEKLWPAKMLPHVRTVNGLIVAAFAGFIAILGAMSVLDHFQDWRSAPGAALVPSIDWPKWIVFIVIPYSFGMISLRYLARALKLLPQPEAPDAVQMAGGNLVLEDR